MKEFIKTKKTYVVALAVLFVFVSLSGTTYSLFLKSDTTNEFNYNTGLLDLEFVEDEQISLENAFPMSDSEGIKQEPYVLTLKNTGSITYLFDLKMLSNIVDNSINPNYIKIKVNDNLPITLSSNDGILESNIVIYPNEEISFKINVWLDKDTPNNELGKKFSAKVSTTGSGIYKTIDASGANHPDSIDGMIPVYYDETLKVWKKADKSNTISEHTWYNYDEKKWANSVIVKNSEKQVFDITGNNNIKVNSLNVNNNNVIIEDNYFDLQKSYVSDKMTGIFRVKFNDLADNNYIVSNDNISFYYNNVNKTLVFKSDNNSVSSDAVNIEKNKWYIMGYVYDGYNISFYLDGNKISESRINGINNSNSSFKVGTDNSAKAVSKITVGDILMYNRVLTDNEIASNYGMSMNIIKDGLVSGYSSFMPMTINEYYLSSKNGTVINNEDIASMFVWIPRFKYKVWNVLGEDNVDSYDAYHKGVDVSFENLTASSGTIFCESGNCFSDNLKTIKVTSNDNNKYYTHPAFSKTTQELTGLWVSKYELSNGNSSKTNNNVLLNTYLSDFYKQVKGISNTYDYHVIKNTEWGAITYLTHSKYGICNNGNCINMGSNNSNVSGNNINDSTTGNIYGVFDMSGSANEYVMANISSNNSINLDNSLFKDVALGNDDYDLYNQNMFILGDATKELSLGESNWYDTDKVYDTSKNWIVRSKLYGYSTSNDVKDENISTRMIIK